MVENWREYAVTGMSIEFIPASVTSAATGTETPCVLNNIWLWVDSDYSLSWAGITPQQIATNDSFKSYSGRQHWKRYFNFRTYSA